MWLITQRGREIKMKLSQAKKNLGKICSLEKMTPLWTERRWVWMRLNYFHLNKNGLANFFAFYSLLSSLKNKARLTTLGAKRRCSLAVTLTFLCPFPWQLFFSCQNCLIRKPKKTAALIGQLWGGQDGETAVKRLLLSFITHLYLLFFLLRKVQV